MTYAHGRNIIHLRFVSELEIEHSFSGDSDEDLDDEEDQEDIDEEDDSRTHLKTRTGCIDPDGDGWSDPTESWQAHPYLGGKNACLDTDGDGWADVDDAFPTEISQWDDVDEDGW